MERNRNSEENSCFVYCLAKALFANESETSDEISFNKGDILTVLEQNPSGLIGWWLCSLNGRQGIAPANRLRLMPGMYDKTGGLGYSSLSNKSANSSPQLNYNNNDKNKTIIIDTRRKSWNSFLHNKTNNKTIINNNYEYDFPQKLENIEKNEYDFPINRKPICQQSYDEPKPYSKSQDSLNTSVPLNEHLLYDIPIIKHNKCPSSTQSQSPCSSSSSSLDISLSINNSSFNSNNSSNRSSIEKNENFYDIPREPRKLDINEIVPIVPIIEKEINNCYDIPNNKPIILSQKPSKEKNSQNINENKNEKKEEKLIEYNINESQLILFNYENECQKYIKILFNNYIIGSKWRTIDNLLNDEKIQELKLLLNNNLIKSLNNFQSFVKQSLLNGRKNSTDNQMIKKLEKLLNQLNYSINIVENAIKSINEEKNGLNWTLNKLLINYNIEEKQHDQLEQLVCCSRGLSEDIKYLSSFIKGNIKLLFLEQIRIDKKPPIAPKPIKYMTSRPLPPLPSSVTKQKEDEHENDDDFHDYEDSPDYVSLESKEFFNNENKKIKEILSKDLHKSYESLIKEIEIPLNYGKLLNNSENNEKTNNSTNLLRDQQLIQFYRSQIEIHFNVFKNSIELFIKTVDKNHAPKVFINNSKFVVICAQKLVYIGLNLYKLLINSKLKQIINIVTNELIDSIGHLVRSTRLAAEKYPQQLSVQLMLDSLQLVETNANHLKNAI